MYLVEYRGHRLLEAARQADTALVKKNLSSDIVNFRHPYTGDTALVGLTTVLVANIYLKHFLAFFPWHLGEHIL